jgi:hypothetical protein
VAMECPIPGNWIFSLVSCTFLFLGNHPSHGGSAGGNSLRMCPRLSFWFSFWPSCSLFYSAESPSSLSFLAWSGHGCSPSTLVLFPGTKTILKIIFDRVDSACRPHQAS